MKGYCYGTHSRFHIEEFVGRDGDTTYMVRDADWVLDSEIHDGKRSPTVAQLPTAKEAEKWCDLVEEGKIRSIPHASNFIGWPELADRVEELDR